MMELIGFMWICLCTTIGAGVVGFLVTDRLILLYCYIKEKLGK